MPYKNKTAITLREKTKRYLDRGRANESWDNYLRELMDFWQKNN